MRKLFFVCVLLWSGSAMPGLNEAIQAIKMSDFKTAEKELRILANKNDPEGQWLLGLLYRIGQGVPQDDKLAAEWLRKSAEQGNAKAQHLLGSLYADGKGVPQDDNLAAEWIRKAAVQGNANAQYELGLRYKKGTGVEQNFGEAYFWALVAHHSGVASAKNLANSLIDKLTTKQIIFQGLRARGWTDTHSE